MGSEFNTKLQVQPPEPVREATSARLLDLCVNEMTLETWDGIEGGASHSIPPVRNLEDRNTTQRKAGRFQLNVDSLLYSVPWDYFHSRTAMVFFKNMNFPFLSNLF